MTTQTNSPGILSRVMALGGNETREEGASNQETEEEKMVHVDISLGRHLRPIPCFSRNKGDQPPLTFAFTNTNIHSPAAIQVASTMDHSADPEHCCECTGPCDTMDCNCIQRTGFAPYRKNGRGPEAKVLDSFEFDSEVFECNENCTCSVNKCHNRLVQFPCRLPFEVFKTDKHGWGLRCAVDLPAGTYLGEYTGRLITEDEFNYEIEDDSYCFDCGAHSRFTIDGRLYGNHLRFVNHSCRPNVRFAYVYVNPNMQYPRVCFFTLKDLPAGEELRLDYGPYYWPFLYMARGIACDCGLDECMYKAEVIQDAIERGDRWWEYGWSNNEEAADEEMDEAEDEADEEADEEAASDDLSEGDEATAMDEEASLTSSEESESISREPDV